MWYSSARPETCQISWRNSDCQFSSVSRGLNDELPNLSGLTVLLLFSDERVPAEGPVAYEAPKIGPRSRRSVARPKSSTFTPCTVSMTFAGFKSRWTMP
jgi:hypothetical protein